MLSSIATTERDGLPGARTRNPPSVSTGGVPRSPATVRRSPAGPGGSRGFRSAGAGDPPGAPSPGRDPGGELRHASLHHGLVRLVAELLPDRKRFGRPGWPPACSAVVKARSSSDSASPKRSSDRRARPRPRARPKRRGRRQRRRARSNPRVQRPGPVGPAVGDRAVGQLVGAVGSSSTITFASWYRPGTRPWRSPSARRWPGPARRTRVQGRALPARGGRRRGRSGHS